MTNIKLRCDEEMLLLDPRLYQALVGSLIYSTITIPDSSFCVGLVNDNMHTPHKPAKRILRCVRSTLDMGIELIFR